MSGIVVVGAGHWGPNLIRNFHDDPRSQVRWVVDADERRLKHVQSRYPDVRLSTTLEPALADPDVAATVIATPTSTHYDLVKRSLQAGRHVLVEKPLATRQAHAEELCALAERNELVLMVGHVFVYNAAVRRVRQMIETGSLGTLYYGSMVRTNLGPIRVDVNAAWDLAAHDISIANYWLGVQPLTASATGGTWINDGIEDAVFATLRYPDNVVVSLQSSWLSPRKARDITLVGERRMLTLDDMNLTEPLRIYDKGVTDELTRPGFVDTFASFRASVREGDITIPKVTLGEPLREECEHFLTCIELGTPPMTDGLAGLAVVRTLEALQASIRDNGREKEVR